MVFGASGAVAGEVPAVDAFVDARIARALDHGGPRGGGRASGEGLYFGSQPLSNVSMTIMQPPQHGQGVRATSI